MKKIDFSRRAALSMRRPARVAGAAAAALALALAPALAQQGGGGPDSGIGHTTPQMNGGFGDTHVATVAVTIAGGGTTLTVGSAIFAASDAGKQIYIPGAGATSGSVGAIGSVAVASAGVGYQAIPGINASGTGVIADARLSAYLALESAGLATDGSGCTAASQIATLSGGTLAPGGSAATVVLAFSAGAATGVSSVANAGLYAVLPGTVTYVGNLPALGAIAVTGTDCAVQPTLTVNDGAHGFGVGAIGVGLGGLNYPLSGTTVAINGGAPVTAASLGTVSLNASVAPLATTVAGVLSPTQVMLNAAASTAENAASQPIYWGHDDTAGFANACATGQPVFVPDAIYQIDNAVLTGGCTLFGHAGEAYGASYGSTQVLPYIIASGAAPTRIFDVDGLTSVTIAGVALDCNGTGADGLSAGSSKLTLDRVSIANCAIGIGGEVSTTLYTHAARLVNTVFYGNQRGAQDLIDTAMTGGSISANQIGWDLEAGSNGSSLSNTRVEWNTRNGVQLYNVTDFNATGGLFDRNYACGLSIGGASNALSSQISITGVGFTRNGRNYSGAAQADADICMNNESHVVVTGGYTRSAADDGGGGPVSPQYVVNFSAAAPGSGVTFTGNDLTGFTNAWENNGLPSSFTSAGNLGAPNTVPVWNDILIATGTSSWTAPAGIVATTPVDIIIDGGGGGGGYCNTGSEAGLPGGGGAHMELLAFTGLNGGTSYTTSIAAGGAGGISTSTSGGSPTATTITINATTYTVNGGVGGGPCAGTGSRYEAGGAAPSGGTINLAGGPGFIEGQVLDAGGANPDGMPGLIVGAAIACAPATGYGAGGSGGTGVGQNGCAGAPGLIRVKGVW